MVVTELGPFARDPREVLDVAGHENSAFSGREGKESLVGRSNQRRLLRDGSNVVTAVPQGFRYRGWREVLVEQQPHASAQSSMTIVSISG